MFAEGVPLKFVPVIVTDVPTGPLVGAKPEMVGGEATVNVLPLVPVSAPTVTVIVPVVAPLGTVTTSCVAVAVVGVAAVVPLNLTVLLAAVVLKFVPVIVTVVPIGPLVGVKLVIVGGETVKVPLLVPVKAPTVTEIFPVVAPLGTLTTSCVAVAVVGVAAVVPLNLTVLLAAVVLKFVPVIVTVVPTGPLVGVKLVTVGGETVKVPLLVPVKAPTVTEIFPVVAPLGTLTTSCVAVAVVGVAAVVPLNLTVLFAAVVLKFVPVIVTVVPIGPLVGVKLVTVGGDTVKLVLLVPVNVLTVTVIVPVVAPLGTFTTNFVVVAELGTAVAIPLNLTVLLDGVALKFVPLIVTDVPTGPLVGVKLVIVGAAAVADCAPMTIGIQINSEMARRSQPNRTPCIGRPIANIKSLPIADIEVAKFKFFRLNRVLGCYFLTLCMSPSHRWSPARTRITSYSEFGGKPDHSF